MASDWQADSFSSSRNASQSDHPSAGGFLTSGCAGACGKSLALAWYQPWTVHINEAYGRLGRAVSKNRLADASMFGVFWGSGVQIRRIPWRKVCKRRAAKYFVYEGFVWFIWVWRPQFVPIEGDSLLVLTGVIPLRKLGQGLLIICHQAKAVGSLAVNKEFWPLRFAGTSGGEATNHGGTESCQNGFCFGSGAPTEQVKVMRQKIQALTCSTVSFTDSQNKWACLVETWAALNAGTLGGNQEHSKSPPETQSKCWKTLGKPTRACIVAVVHC